MVKTLDNLARREYDSKIDKQVKEELEIAKIPVFELPAYMNTEVKTKYIGILNGFAFYRAWRYWVCEGDMPLDVANYIYENYKDLKIRAGGHAGNIEPNREAYNPIYERELRMLSKKVTIEKYLELSKEIVDDLSLPRFVNCYHIDTQLGLCKLARS